MRTALGVIGMFAFGAAALMGMSLLYRHRVTAPFPTAAAPASVVEGLQIDLEFFASAMAADARSDAVAALDGAYRLSDVLRGASGSPAEASALFEQIRSVRRAVQNDQRQRAIDLARRAAATASAIGPAESIAPGQAARYVGAIVLTPSGEIRGTVAGVGGGAVTIAEGAVRGLLGLASAGATGVRRVPIDAVLFGARRRFGMTMVVDRTAAGRRTGP